MITRHYNAELQATKQTLTTSKGLKVLNWIYLQWLSLPFKILIERKPKAKFLFCIDEGEKTKHDSMYDAFPNVAKKRKPSRQEVTDFAHVPYRRLTSYRNYSNKRLPRINAALK